MKIITQSTLGKYVNLLGRGSIAEEAMRHYVAKKDEGYKPTIYLRNNGFAVKAAGVTKYFG